MTARDWLDLSDADRRRLTAAFLVWNHKMKPRAAARVLGAHPKRVYEWSNDPWRRKRRARRAAAGGTCEECGGPTCAPRLSTDPLPRRCGGCVTGTRFRRTRWVCGAPGCQHHKAHGHHLCDDHLAPIERVRAEMEREASERDYRPDHLFPSAPNTEDDILDRRRLARTVA